MMRRAQRGFTLTELLLAAMLGALVAGATTIALSMLLNSRTRIAVRERTSASARLACDMIARDAMGLVRDADLARTRFAIMDEPHSEGRDELLMLVRTDRRVRSEEDVPEGADFEVQYRIAPSDDATALWRRADPALDPYQDAGGVARVVAMRIVGLQLEASDGESWFSTWDSDYDGLPHGLRITVTATSEDGRVLRVSRRAVSIDRTPAPLEPLVEDA